MINKYISEIISRYFNGQHSVDTELKVQKWLTEDENSEAKDKALFGIWNDIRVKPDAGVYSSLRKVQQRLGMKRAKLQLWQTPVFRVAAVLLPLMLAVGVYFAQHRGANMVEIVSLAGEQKEVTLPDGSTVWMNACSRISYPEQFEGEQREIELSGEAMFSVTKDTTRTFIVTTQQMDVTVLGTVFNVKAYEDDNFTRATLICGAVAVSVDSDDYRLNPNQELIYDHSNEIIKINDIEDGYVQWSESVLAFNNITLLEILSSIERQYGITFEYTPSDYAQDRYSVKFRAKDSIDQIMTVMQELVGGFSYSIENNIITIKKE